MDMTEKLDALAAGYDAPVFGVEVIARGSIWPEGDEDAFTVRCVHDPAHLSLRFPRADEAPFVVGHMEMVECSFCSSAAPVGGAFAPRIERLTLGEFAARAERLVP
jgi:hypothetical protein